MSDTGEAPFLFDRDGERFVPAALARGPWYPDTQHGSPVLGLLARAVESLPAERPMQVARFTADLMRAAPLAPVEVRVDVRRSGKYVEQVDASLVAGGDEYARATALRIRIGDVAVPEALDGAAAEPPPLPRDDGGMGWPVRAGDALHEAFEIRPVPGFETPTVWFRLTVPLVRGEPLTPLVRVATTCDFTYGVSVIRRMRLDRQFLLRTPVVAINPDTTLNLHRPLEGEWLCLDTRAHVDGRGAATASARLYDARGLIGFASQSLLVRGPEAAPASWRRYSGEPG
jgi:acyl-CoA thioesterase